jgi:threonine/homoserine/homoserine lactone efflux protein
MAFVAATTLLVVIPGPTILLVIGYALAEGRRSIIPTATGVLLGDFVAMTAAVIGLGAVLAALRRPA